MYERCYDLAHKDYYMLHEEMSNVNLVGGIVTKVYRSETGPKPITGIVIEDEDGNQHVIVPTCPNPSIKKEDQGWLNSYLCHIPIPSRGIKKVFSGIKT